MVASRQLVSTGLYIHAPFCVHKCGYCDFNSWAETRRGPQETWLAALEKQINFWAAKLGENGVGIDTVFYGGGTPSLLENDLLVKSGELIRKAFDIDPGVEWTIEANPETLDAAKLAALRDAGATRLSIGIQSFEDRFLERLERRARSVDNLRALELVAREWKGSWSADFMFGLPGQSIEDWDRDLAQILSFDPKHVSAYQLTLTTARSKNWAQPPEADLLAFFNHTEQRLGAAGLGKYETSNFAAPGFESRHNLRYWRLQTFLGLGPGAAGLLPGSWVDPAAARWGFHQKQPDAFETWIAHAGVPEREFKVLTPRTAPEHFEEMLMMGLRLREGLAATRLGPLNQFLTQAQTEPQVSGFIELANDYWRPTDAGARILDTLLHELFRRIEEAPTAWLDSPHFDPTFR